MADTLADLWREVGLEPSAVQTAIAPARPPLRPQRQPFGARPMPRQMRSAEARAADARLAPAERTRAYNQVQRTQTPALRGERLPPSNQFAEAGQMVWEGTGVPAARRSGQALHEGRYGDAAWEGGASLLALGSLALPLPRGGGPRVALRPMAEAPPAIRPPPRLPGRASDGSVLPVRPTEPFRNSLRGGSDDLMEAARPTTDAVQPNGLIPTSRFIPNQGEWTPQMEATVQREIRAGRFSEEDVPLANLTATQESVFPPNGRRSSEPPTVYRDNDGRMWLVDGHHRASELAAGGDTSVRVRVYGAPRPTPSDAARGTERARRQVYDAGMGSGAPFEMVRNPSEADISRLLRSSQRNRQNPELRYITDADGNVYVGEARSTTHDGMATEAGVSIGSGGYARGYVINLGDGPVFVTSEGARESARPVRELLRPSSDATRGGAEITVTREADQPAEGGGGTESYYVARTADGEFAGHVRVLTDPRTGQRFPEDIMVRPEFRRRGIASQIMDAVRADFGDIAPTTFTDDGRGLWGSIQRSRTRPAQSDGGNSRPPPDLNKSYRRPKPPSGGFLFPRRN